LKLKTDQTCKNEIHITVDHDTKKTPDYFLTDYKIIASLWANILKLNKKKNIKHYFRKCVQFEL